MNPYKVVEKILAVLGWTLIGAVIAFSLFMVVLTFLREGWGWYTLLLIPGIPLGIILLALIGAVGSTFVYWVENKWTYAKYEWANRASKEDES